MKNELTKLTKTNKTMHISYTTFQSDRIQTLKTYDLSHIISQMINLMSTNSQSLGRYNVCRL